MDASRLFSGNFTPLLLKTQADLSTYTTKWLSWLGRVNTLKINVLPRFLYYLLQTIPLSIPTLYFRKLHKMFSSFIWKAAFPRIKYETFSLPKAGVLDASLYDTAAVLTGIVDWFHHSSSKLWVHLESHLNSIELCALPWTLAVHRKESSLFSNLTCQTHQIWDD